MTEQVGTTAPGHYCHKCGTRLRPGTRFCTGCGNDTSAVASPVTAPPVTAPPVTAPPVTAPPVTASRVTAPSDISGATGPYHGQAPRDPDGRPETSRRGWLAIAGGVVAVAGVAALVVVVAHPFGHAAAHRPGALSRARTAASKATATSPTPTSPATSSPAVSSSPATQSPAVVTEQQAAVSLAALLARSASSRQAIDAAYNDVLQCGPNLTQDAQTFQDAATAHQQLLSDLAQLPGRSLLPQAMLSDLVSAWEASTSADDDFARWAADEVSSGCSIDDQSDPNFEAADAPDLQATASKTAFVKQWNPLASTYGLPTYQQNQF